MIYIVRHGQTELNRQQVLQGRSNHPLNEDGFRQARETARKLEGISFDAVYSSPLLRAVQTAELIVPGCRPILDERLIEMEYGPYEGMSLRAPAPEVLRFFRDFAHTPAPDGMEPLESVVQRAGAFLRDRCQTHGNLLISTHAIAMKGLLEVLTPDSHGSYWSRMIGNCAVFAVEYRPDGTWSLPREL